MERKKNKAVSFFAACMAILFHTDLGISNKLG